MPCHPFTVPIVIVTALLRVVRIDCFFLTSTPLPTTRKAASNSISLHRCPSMTASSSVAATDTAIHHYNLRPYNPRTDRIALEQICANVYNGSDYLPQMAESYAADPLCSFLTLAAREEEDGILAVANYKRLPSQQCAWIEAVRTHPIHRNKGLASLLLRELINLAIIENDALRRNNTQHNGSDNRTTKTLLTCTIRSNAGMRRALEKVGFLPHRTIPTLSFEALKRLPGWSFSSTAPARPQPLLTALNLHHSPSPRARKLASSSSRWNALASDVDLLRALETCRRRGNTCGYLPGLYEYIVPAPSRDDLRRSMEHGLVVAMHPDDDDDRDSADEAILALVRDERISSLKSQWVCSIVAYTNVGFEAALLYAHSVEVATRMRGLLSSIGVERDGQVESEGGENVAAMPFCLVFDDAVPLEEGTLAHALPRVTDECLVYSCVCEE
ncbi:hypothetical protein ACHAW6_012179 [Cyclotella cf. meneghiniana]